VWWGQPKAANPDRCWPNRIDLDPTRVLQYRAPMAQKVPMTPQGYRALQERLKQISGPDRNLAVKALSEARSHGDLSENAEYEIAKDTLAKIDQQIVDLQNVIANAEIIDPAQISHDKIVFGATVGLRDLDNKSTVTYQIVGVHESNITDGKISIESPIARALIGKEQGDETTVQTPKGLRSFEILSIRYG